MLFSPGVLCLHFVHLCPPVRFPHFSSATSEESCFISLSPSQHCFLPPLSQPDISHISHGKEKLRNGNGEIKLYQYCLKSILLLLNFSILSLLGKQIRNCHLPWFQPLCWWIFFPSSLGRYLPNLWVLAQTWPPRKLFLLLRQGPRGLSKWTVFVEGFVLDFRAAALSTTLSWKQCIIWRHEYGHFWSVILSLWNNYRFATKWQKLFKGYLYIYIDNFPYFYY